MSGYIVGFTVYTMAMLGVIFLAFVVAKKSMTFGGFSKKEKQFLEIESTLGIGVRKNIYVLKAGEERFLIASDPEKTSFLTKLDQTTDATIAANSIQSLQTPQIELNDKNSDEFLKNILHKNRQNDKKSIMRGILEKLNEEVKA